MSLINVRNLWFGVIVHVSNIIFKLMLNLFSLCHLIVDVYSLKLFFPMSPHRINLLYLNFLSTILLLIQYYPEFPFVVFKDVDTCLELLIFRLNRVLFECHFFFGLVISFKFNFYIVKNYKQQI